MCSSDGVVPLPLVKLRRHRDDGFVNGYTQLSLGHLLHFQQQPGTDELRAHGEGPVCRDQKLSTAVVADHLVRKTEKQKRRQRWKSRIIVRFLGIIRHLD